MAQRFWTCRRCSVRHPRRRQKCSCGGKRPERRTAAQKALAEPYEAWVGRFGEVCGICGAGPSERRRLDRDHCHKTGVARGVLCSSCNRMLTGRATIEWLDKAAEYLRRSMS